MWTMHSLDSIRKSSRIPVVPNMGRVKHLNEHAKSFRAYLSTETKANNFASCLCPACYTDAKKYSKLDNKREPRWVTVHRNATMPQKVNHCTLCHNNSVLTNCDGNNVHAALVRLSFMVSWLSTKVLEPIHHN